MMGGLAVILACQVVGEVLVRLTGMPVPGPVAGMVLFFGWLQWRRPDDQSGSVRAASTLMRYLSIMFVPVTVGIVVHGRQLASQWLPAVVGSFGTWLLTFVLVGWVAMLLRPRPRQEAS
ncbi:CidA/LrgA family protein [Aestuariimicrobium ganziense]|uniref:CidA/LrgA family protein n=1 Tax=Aestuariimicrobium ganziense TaxID=2773677 RepID=UPI0019450ED9|nr:CidA/LrgA family protein [Aestuariimicrobium ganziense]